jgi:rhodanese-related sulfurtransferase
VYCGSGYRASIAASILDRLGRQVVLINDVYDVARITGLEQPPNGAHAPLTAGSQPAQPPDVDDMRGLVTA